MIQYYLLNLHYSQNDVEQQLKYLMIQAFEYYSLDAVDDLLLNYSMLFPRYTNEINLKDSKKCFVLEIYSLVHNEFVDLEIVQHVSLNVIHRLFENYSERK